MLIACEDGDLACPFELFHDSKSHEGDDSLAIGWAFPDLEARIIGVALKLTGDSLAIELDGNGIDLFASTLALLFQIVEREMTAEVSDHFDHGFGDAAFVETFLTVPS